MASELFWTAFAAIGQAVGAIATAAAVIVTLWQVRYSNKNVVIVDIFLLIYLSQI